MKKILAIFLYYYSALTLVKWLALLGVIFLVIQVVVSEQKFAFIFSVFGYGLAIMTPTLIAPPVFRQLISNRRLSLVPGFTFCAGIALLILTLLTSLYVPLASMIFTDDGATVSFMVSLLAFAGVSLYIAITQLFSTSRFGAIIVVIIPVLWIFLVPYAIQLKSFFLDERVIFSLFFLAVLGWCYGLYLLATKTSFKAPYLPVGIMGRISNASQQGWSGGGGSVFYLGTKGTSAGTLLQRYPDGLAGMLGLVITQTILGPITIVLFFVVFIAVVGGNADKAPFTLSEGFLLASMYCSCFSTIGCAELLARSRLIWLRQLGDRSMLWDFLEKIFIKRFGLSYLCTFLVAVCYAIFTDVALVILAHYFIIVVSVTFATLYISTLFRVRAWHEILLGLLMFPFMILLMVAIVRGYTQADYSYIIALESGFIILGLVARYVAKQTFNGIDWCKIKPILRNLRVATD